MGPVSECSGFQAIIWIPGQNLDIFFRLNHMIKVLVSRLYGGLNTGPIFKCACYLKSGDLNNGQAYYWCSLFRSPLYLTKNVLYSKLYLYRALALLDDFNAFHFFIFRATKLFPWQRPALSVAGMQAGSARTLQTRPTRPWTSGLWERLMNLCPTERKRLQELLWKKHPTDCITNTW